MTKYREILRLHSLGRSQQNIADSCGVSKKAVNRVLKRATELEIVWPLGGAEEPLADAILDHIAHDSYRINIKSIVPEHDISMREIYGLAKSLRE